MASADKRPGDRHRHPPIAYRPPADAREWLIAHAEATGTPVSSLITQAVREYRERVVGKPQAAPAEP